MMIDKKGFGKYITLFVLITVGIGLMYVSYQNYQHSERIIKNQESNVIIFLDKINSLLEENEEHLEVTIDQIKNNRNNTHQEISDLMSVLNTTLDELRDMKAVINNLNNTN